MMAARDIVPGAYFAHGKVEYECIVHAAYIVHGNPPHTRIYVDYTFRGQRLQQYAHPGENWALSIVTYEIQELGVLP